jgi:hypothetical protein
MPFVELHHGTVAAKPAQSTLPAIGSDRARLATGTLWFRDALNQQRSFIPLRLDDAPIKGALARFLYINWLPQDRK